MRKVLLILAIGCLVLGAGAQAQIDGSKHDLSNTGGSSFKATSETQICVFCHTPHGGESSPALWNHAYSTVAASDYTMYSSDTIDMTIDNAPGDVSKACMSCHDGTVALGSVTNTPGSGITAGTIAMNTTIMTGAKVLGKDLSNDHPISIAYDRTSTTGDPDFKDISSSTKVQLYSGKVECGSCHDPHLTTYTPFLRSSNDSSLMCLECHDK